MKNMENTIDTTSLLNKFLAILKEEHREAELKILLESLLKDDDEIFAAKKSDVIAYMKHKIENKEYNDWLALREESKNNKDETGRRLCYCGHTTYCECADPDEILFKESVKRGSIIIGDPTNGWGESKKG